MDAGLRGIIICQPYADRIMAGRKRTECRSRRTKIIGEDVLLLSEGLALGVIRFTKVTERPADRKYRYAWHVRVVKRFSKPKPYRKNHGAVIWIRTVRLTNKT